MNHHTKCNVRAELIQVHPKLGWSDGGHNVAEFAIHTIEYKQMVSFEA